MEKIMDIIKIVLSGIMAYLFGGFDPMFQMLCIAMGIDFVSGILLATVFHKSTKSKGGTLSSSAAVKGAVRKVCQLMLVIIITFLSRTIGDDAFCRNTAIIFFTANECISILENMGMMGVSYPKWLRDSLEILLKKQENK